MDLNHVVPFMPATRIRAGDYSNVVDAVVTVIAVGVNQQPGQGLGSSEAQCDDSRSDAPEDRPQNPDRILFIATNPVDILTYVSCKLSGLPSERAIGSRATLDTGRFRFLLDRCFGMHPRSGHARIIGEHGASEALVWSLGNAAGNGYKILVLSPACPLKSRQWRRSFPIRGRCLLDHRREGGNLFPGVTRAVNNGIIHGSIGRYGIVERVFRLSDVPVLGTCDMECGDL